MDGGGKRRSKRVQQQLLLSGHAMCCVFDPCEPCNACLLDLAEDYQGAGGDKTPQPSTLFPGESPDPKERQKTPKNNPSFEDIELELGVLPTCGHVFHANCVLMLLTHKWSTLKITFGYLDCPSCKQEIFIDYYVPSVS